MKQNSGALSNMKYIYLHTLHWNPHYNVKKIYETFLPVIAHLRCILLKPTGLYGLSQVPNVIETV